MTKLIIINIINIIIINIIITNITTNIMSNQITFVMINHYNQMIALKCGEMNEGSD